MPNQSLYFKVLAQQFLDEVNSQMSGPAGYSYEFRIFQGY